MGSERIAMTALYCHPSHQTNPNLTVPISALKEALWSHARKSTVMMAGSV